MLGSMLLLTFNAAIFNQMASGAFLQFDVINFCGAAGCTTHHAVAHLKKNITAPIKSAPPQARTTWITK
jgi:hypothetical protein